MTNDDPVDLELDPDPPAVDPVDQADEDPVEPAPPTMNELMRAAPRLKSGPTPEGLAPSAATAFMNDALRWKPPHKVTASGGVDVDAMLRPSTPKGAA